jgi:3-oxoacyl-[acyl-carrier-protein] synthase II
LCSLRGQNTAPPTINLTSTGDSELDLNYVPLTAQQRTIKVALNNSFGFGGTNACLAFSALQ